MERLMRRFVSAVLIVVIVAFAAAAVFTYSGAANVAADVPHGGLTSWWLGTVRSRAVERAARNVQIVLPELTRRARHEAVVGYESMCAICHAPPGREPSALAQGLNPAPPDLARAARNHPPEELLWVTRHGIRMTGMPAWGPTHNDDELLALVALVMEFPDMDGAAYASLLAEARDAGIEHMHDHDHDHDHDHGPHHEHGGQH
jgi:mono/diheme cytochrome c family protein